VYPGCWQGGLLPVWRAFWDGYLGATLDREVLEVLPPFFAWRALVVASPVWYPGITGEARDGLLAFAEAALDAGGLDPAAPSFAP
jgi:hypothetical protein